MSLLHEMKTPELFSIEAFAIGGRQHPWASGYGPLPNLADMPFLETMAEPIKKMLVDSWKINSSPPGIAIDPGGRKWSHFIGNGSGYPSFFVSDHVLADLNEANIDIFRATQMPITSIKAKTLQKLPPPKYYILEATPGLEIWSESVPIEVQIAAREKDPLQRIDPYLTKCKASTWNGSDLFSPSHGKSSTSVFCTERVKKLAEQKAWTNVCFKKLEPAE